MTVLSPPQCSFSVFPVSPEYSDRLFQSSVHLFPESGQPIVESPSIYKAAGNKSISAHFASGDKTVEAIHFVILDLAMWF
jgi:hypothetical protein